MALFRPMAKVQDEPIAARFSALRDRAKMSMAVLAGKMGMKGASSIQRYFNAEEFSKTYLPQHITIAAARALAGHGQPPVTEAEVLALAGLEHNPGVRETTQEPFDHPAEPAPEPVVLEAQPIYEDRELFGDIIEALETLYKSERIPYTVRELGEAAMASYRDIVAEAETPEAQKALIAKDIKARRKFIRHHRPDLFKRPLGAA